MMSWKCLSKYSKGIHSKEPPRAEPHAWWCERSENEVGRKLLRFPPTRFALCLLFCINRYGVTLRHRHSYKNRLKSKKHRQSSDYQCFFTSRGDWIRTSDHTPPRRVLYSVIIFDYQHRIFLFNYWLTLWLTLQPKTKNELIIKLIISL